MKEFDLFCILRLGCMFGLFFVLPEIEGIFILWVGEGDICASHEFDVYMSRAKHQQV